MEPKGLIVRALSFGRGSFRLQVDLDLAPGAFGVLLGPSGCGKTTTLRLLAGLVGEEGGSIRLGGRELRGLPPESRRVGLVFQDFALFPHLSARRNIEYGPRLAGLGRREARARAEGLARRLRISGLLDRRPADLSGGEQQRVALARSLAARPDLLLLDEPLSSLDATLRRELREEIRTEVGAAGIPALQVCHDLEEALALGDSLFLMDAGRVVEAGPPEEVWERPRTAFAARLLGRGIILTIMMISGQAPGLARTAAGDFPLASPRSDAEARGAGPGTSLLLPGPFTAVSAAGERDPGLLRGRVLGAAYEGGPWRLRLETGAGILEVAALLGRRPALGEVLAISPAGPGLPVAGD